MGRGLTDRQKEILGFIIDYVSERGYSPSMRDVADHFGFKSVYAAYDHIKVLAKKGYLNRAKGKSRSIEVLKTPEGLDFVFGVKSIPLLGAIPAGALVTAYENIEKIITVSPSFFRGKPDFAIRVNGGSMTEAGIFDGDLCFVRIQNVAEKGEIVVAQADGESTIKRYMPKNGFVVLQAESDSDSSILVDETTPGFRIVGKVVGIVREY